MIPLCEPYLPLRLPWGYTGGKWPVGLEMEPVRALDPAPAPAPPKLPSPARLDRLAAKDKLTTAESSEWLADWLLRINSTP